MSLNPRVRRHRVILRPKARNHRMRQHAAVAAIAVLGAAAAATLAHMPWRKLAAQGFGSRLPASPESIDLLGGSDELQRQVRAFLRAQGPATLETYALGLKQRFGCLKSVAVRRDWLGKRARLSLEMHRAVGRVLLGGRPAGLLSDTAAVFVSPEGLYDIKGPLLEVGGADAGQLKALADFLGLAVRPGALPAPLERARLVSAREGWELKLADGTAVQWGALNWTQEKLSRLREVAADARPQLGALSADLRYFEDGKILVRPASGRPAAR